MVQNETFYFDTYAVFEILRSNANYLKYAKSNVITSKLNLFELCYTLMRDFGEKDTIEKVKKYYKFVRDFNLAVLTNAAKFKLMNRSLNLSLVDCVGYFIAKSMGVKFLTGDEKFRDMPNVEFVK